MPKPSLTNSLSLYVPKNSWLHRLHPFNKLTYIFLIGIAAYVEPGDIPTLLLATFLNLGLAAASGIFTRSWALFWRTLLPLGIFMLPIHGLLNPNNETILFAWRALTLYREGLLFAVRTLLQVAAVLSASLLFVYTTHPADLVAVLQNAGWSQGLAYVFSSPLLLLPAMRERIETIRAAQAARGLSAAGNILQRTRTLFPLLAPLVLGAFAEIEERSIALDVRAFNSPGVKTLWRVVPDSRSQRFGRWGIFFLSVFLILLRVFTA